MSNYSWLDTDDDVSRLSNETTVDVSRFSNISTDDVSRFSNITTDDESRFSNEITNDVSRFSNITTDDESRFSNEITDDVFRFSNETTDDVSRFLNGTTNDVSRFSNDTTEQNCAKICLKQDSLEDNSILEPKSPENICKTINCDTEVVHTFGHFNPLKENLEKRPDTLVFTNKSCETPLLLNFESIKPKKLFIKSNAVLKPCIMDNIIHSLDTKDEQPLDHEKLDSYVEQSSHTNLQTQVPVVPTVQSENQQLPIFKIFNANQSYSTTFRPPDQSQYSFNNNTINIQENDPHFSQILPNSIERQESVIKYCESTQNKNGTINTLISDPRLINHNKNKYEQRLSNFEELKQIKYNKKSHLNEDLEKINRKLKNANSSYRFGVLNGSDIEHINEHDIECIEEPLVNHIKCNNSQNDLEIETSINCNKVLKHANTEQDQKKKCREVSAVIDLTDDNVVSCITIEDDDNALKNCSERKNEQVNTEQDQKKKCREVSVVIDLTDDNVVSCITIEDDDNALKNCSERKKEQVNTEKNKKKKCREVSAVIDLTDDNVVSCITIEDDDNALKNCSERKKELKVSSDFHKKKLKHSIENIIGNLNDNITNDSSCTTRMISQKKKEMKITYNSNDQTNNYVDPVNRKTLVSENSSFNNTRQIADDNISGLIEQNKNSKPIKSIENSIDKFIKKKHTDFRYRKNVIVDVSENPDVDTGMIATELENTKCMSKVNVSKDKDKFDHCSEISEKLYNKKHSVIKEYKKSKKSKKSKNNKHKHKSPKHNQSKDNDKSSKTHKNKDSSKTDSKVFKIVSEFENISTDLITNGVQSSNKQANNKKTVKKLDRTILRANKNEVRNESDKIIQLENKTVNIKKKHVENASEFKKNNESGFDSTEIVCNKSRIKVKSNTNIFTESVAPALHTVKETHYTHDKLSKTEQNSNKTTAMESNFTDSTHRYKKQKASTNLKKHINDTIELNDKMDVLNVSGSQSSITGEKIKSKSYQSTSVIKPLDLNYGNKMFIDCRAKNVNTKISCDEKSNLQLNENKHLIRNNKINEPQLPNNLKSSEISSTRFNVKPMDVLLDKKYVKRDAVKDSLKSNIETILPNAAYLLDEIIEEAKEEETKEKEAKDKAVKIKCSKLILNENSKTDDANKLNCEIYEDLFKLGNFGDSNENKSLTLKGTTMDDTRSNKPFEDGSLLTDCFIAKEKANDDEISLSRSTRDNIVKQPFDNDLEPEKISQDCNIGIQPNLSHPVVDTRNSLDNVIDIIETKNINTSTQSTDHISFSKWKEIKIKRDIVESKYDVHLKPGQHIVNNGIPVDGMSYHFVNTSYRKEYFRNLKDMLSDEVKSKWIYDKMTTTDNHVSLYKCSGRKCKETFGNRSFFRTHLNDHCHDSDNRRIVNQFMQCMYCFKQFSAKSIGRYTNHITENYTFCKYFCRYCLYRAYTASHVLIHEYVFHNDQKPSILKLKNRRGERKEIVKAVDFKKFVPRYVCNIGCCTFSSYINSDFLSHLRLDHVHCDQFFCDLCAKNNDNGFVSSNPKIFVKHFNLHKINKYQCIFCLFGAECIEVIIIHLAMEHFEYEPLCLERSPKNDVCDKRKIKNLNILNIKKYVPDEIIEVVGTNLIKKISIKESLTKEMNDTRQMDPDDMFTNTKIDEVDNSAQLLNKIFKKIAQSSRNTSTAIDKKKNEVTLSDEVKQKVSQDTQQIQNVIAPIVNEKKKPSELSNDNLINNFEIQISGNSLETHSSEKPIDLSKKYVTKSAILNKLISIKTIDKVTQNIHSSENRLNYCPIESPKESTFSIAQSDTVWNSSYEADKLPKRLRLNRFTCTFCNLELPSSDIVKRHVRKEHNISNLEFVPVDINATDIEKDRFLVCQDKSSKTKKRSNDCIVLTDDYDSTTTVHKKRFKVDNKYNDSQLTALPNTLNTPEQHTGRSKVKSREKHKILKRKHSSDSCNNISNKKTSNPYMSNDTILGTTIEKYFSSENIDGIPETEYFLEPMRCLFCDYQTKVRSNLMAHIKKHRVEPKDSTENIFKSISCNSNSVFTSMNMISSFTSLFDVQQNEKAKSDKNNKDFQIATSITTISSFNQDKPFENIPQFVSKRKRFKCAFYGCNFTGLNIEILKTHILNHHNIMWLFICPHCKPIQIKLVNFRELKWHFNHHAENLYFCQYCSFIHFKREKIKAHMKRKHSSFIEGENEFNIIAIRKQKPIQNIIPLDQQISKWICKLCGYDVKYTKTGIAAHMSKIHNTLNTFKCSICLIDYSDYDVFKKHLKLNHPYSPVNYLNIHVDKVSSGKELQPLNKQTNVGEYDMRTQCNMLNVSETLNSVAESTIIIPGSKEISTTTCSKSAKSIVVSEVQKKILSNPSDYPNDYLTMIQCIAKYVCPVCNVFITEEEQSFCEHLLKEINCKLWKCLECFSISDSLEEMESHIIKHRLEKRKFEKIESFNKNSWVNRIIEHQNILIEYVLLRKFDQNTDFAIQNESKNGNDQSK